jgi:hypothetical protein
MGSIPGQAKSSGSSGAWASVMVDIVSKLRGSVVTFTALTPEADDWMRQHYGRTSLAFSLPAQRREVVKFRQCAEEAELFVSTW